jgi:hypothetical protein
MRKNKLITYFLYFFIVSSSLLFTQLSYAERSFGTIACILMEPVCSLTKVAYNICYIVAIMIFVGSIIQYQAHRRNPSVPLSRSVVLLILAITLGLTPLLAQLSSSSTLAGT